MSRLRLIVSMTLLGLLLVSCGAPAEPAPEVGAPAPDFAIIGLEGQSISLADFEGRPVLLNFWATWCPACRDEMPYLQAAFEKAGDDFVLLAVDIDEPQATVQQFVEEYGLTFTVGLDVGGQVAELYRIGAIPTSFLIDGDGIIRLVKIGAFSSEAEVLAILAGIR